MKKRNIGGGVRLHRHGLVAMAGALTVLATGLVGLPVPASGSPGTTELVSANAAGEPASTDTGESSVSADGRFVAFASTASNLVASDTNGQTDIFVRDRVERTTTRVSVSSTGEQATGGRSEQPDISADGRFVTFRSAASNLVDGDTNGATDIFVHDRQSGTITRASVTNDEAQINGGSNSPDISDNGRFVAFQSGASNLPGGVAGAVYRRDLLDQTTTLASVDLTGGPARVTASLPLALSGDGEDVAFVSFDNDIVPGDTNAAPDVFVRDLQAATTTRVSVNSGGTEGNDGSSDPAISRDGRFVAFSSSATNLVSSDTNARTDVFLHDREGGVTSRVSVSSTGVEGNADSGDPALSADGSRVAFQSGADNLAEERSSAATDVFVRDVPSSTTTVESVDSAGVNRGGANPDIAAGGAFVVFSSGSGDIVPGFRGQDNIFIHELTPAAEPPTSTSSTSTSSTSSSSTSSTSTSTSTSSTSTTSSSLPTSTSTSSTSTSSTSTTSTSVPGDETCDGREPTITGSGTILGTGGADVILGSDGDDFVIGGGGGDLICGGDGDDTIDGRAGNDRLFGGSGDDHLVGAAGDEFLDGGTGADDISGDAGRDELRGGAGNDQLRGGNGIDESFGGEGDDSITDGAGNDILDGAGGTDVLRGGLGDDDLSGGDGNDRLLGENGDDLLDGGGGTNRCNGGGGTNTLISCRRGGGDSQAG